MSDTIRTAPFTLTTGDYLRHYLISYFRMYIVLPWAPFMWLLTFGIPILAGFRHLTHREYLAFATSNLWYSVIWLTLIPAIGLFTTWRSLGRIETTYAQRVATLDSHAFALDGDGFSNHQVWSSFRRVIETPGNVYLVLRAGSAMIVPKRAFASPIIAKQFLAEARKHVRHAGHKQVQAFYDHIDAPEPMAGLVSPSFRMRFGVYFRYCLLVMCRSMLRPTTLIFLLAAFVGFPAWLQRDRLAAGDWRGVLISSIPGLIFFMVVFPLVMTLISWATVARQPAVRGERQVSLAADEVQARGDAYDVKVRWNNIRQVSQTWGLILLWSGPSGAIVVPRTAFADPAAADAFLDQARALWQAAKSA